MSNRYKNILVAVDGSEQAERAFKEALEIASAQQAHLFIAWIINEAELSHSAYSYTKILAEEKEFVEKELLKRIHDAKESMVENVTPIVEIGNVKELLAKTIPEQSNIDLLVLGATGKGAIQQAAIGSTTTYVVSNAPCNVIVVK